MNDGSACLPFFTICHHLLCFNYSVPILNTGLQIRHFEKNSRAKKPQNSRDGFNKINIETEGNYSISATKIHSPINP